MSSSPTTDAVMLVSMVSTGFIRRGLVPSTKSRWKVANVNYGPNTGSLTAAGLLGAVSIVWGASIPLTNVAVNGGMSSTAVATVRITVAAVVLLFLVIMTRSNFSRVTAANLRSLTLAAFFLLAVPHTLMTWSQYYVSSSLAVIIMATVPLFTALFVSIRSRSDDASALEKGAGLVSNMTKLIPGFIGVSILMGSAIFNVNGFEIAGGIAVIIASISCAKAIMIMSKLPDLPPLIASTYITVIASVIMLPQFVLFDTGDEVFASTRSVISVLILGVFCTGLSMIMYSKLTSKFGAIYSSLSFYICPISGLVISAIIVGEKLTFIYFVSISLVLVSAYFVSPNYRYSSNSNGGKFSRN